MQLSPRYDDPGFLECSVSLGDVGAIVVGQRERFATVLADLSDEQWRAPSRCEGWSVRDVVVHLQSTNQFWALSLAAGAAGEPTRYLATFDPVASPAAMVDAAGDRTPGDVLDDFVASNAALADTIEQLDTDAWARHGEAPPGHVGLRCVALHALWDSWVHERDVVLPLGLAPTVVDDEVAAALAYAAALSPAFSFTRDPDRHGALDVVATDPDVRFVVAVTGDGVAVHDGPAPADAARLAGSAVDLLEGLSHRGPLPDMGDDHRWLLQGLAEVFDVDPVPDA